MGFGVGFVGLYRWFCPMCLADDDDDRGGRRG